MDDKEWQSIAEEGLQKLIEGVEVTHEKMDKDGCVHELKAKLPPNIEAIKFALKNKSNGKWADKTEITHTQVNINLSASYDEIKKMMNKEKENAKIPILFPDDEVIDVDKA